MRKLLKVLILLVVVLCFSVNSQEEQMSENQAMNIIQKMESSKFGKTLLDTLQLQMNAGDPVSDLIQLLRDMEFQLQQEQREDDEFIFSLQDQCDQELARLEDQISEAQERIRQLNEELGIKVPRRDEAISQRDGKLALVSLYNEKIAQLDAQKQLKDEEWAHIQDEHDRAQYAIEQAKSIITNALKSRTNLIEISQIAPVFAQVSNHIKTNVKQNQYSKKSWNSIFNLLAEVTQSPGVQADQSAVQKVIELCQDIIAKISESRELERKAYQYWVEEYTNTKNGIQERINEEESQISELNNTIDVLTRRINMATQEKADQQTRVDEKTVQKNDKTQWCNDENVNYSKRRQARDDDREVVSDAIALFNSQIRTFRKYVGQRISNNK